MAARTQTTARPAMCGRTSWLNAPLLVLGSVLVAAGCDLLNGGCDPIIRPGIRVTVLDSVTGQPPPAGVTVVAMDGVYVDTALAEQGGRAYVAVFDRPGIYRVQVTSPNHATWVQDGVRVEPVGECANPTTEVTALLRPAG